MKHDPIRPSSWLHPMDCECRTCFRASPADPDRLTATDIAWHCLAGIVVGNAVAFAWDARGAAAALAACFGVRL